MSATASAKPSPHVGIHVGHAEIDRVRHPQAREVLDVHRRREVGHRNRVGHVVRRRRSRHDRDRQGEVPHRPGERPVHRERLPAAKARFLGDQPERRLVTHHSAERRRDANRAAAVGAEGKRHHAGRDRDRGAATGSAGRPVQVPRVPGQAVHEVVGVAAVAELRVVGLADDDGPSLPESGDADTVRIRGEAGEGDRAVGRRGVTQPDVVLDRDRYAEQGWEHVLATQGPVGGCGLGSGAIGQGDGERVQGAVPRIDPGQCLLDHIAHAPAALPDGRCGRRRVVGRQRHYDRSDGEPLPAVSSSSAACDSSTRRSAATSRFRHRTK